jgi:hypothetical protein
MTETSGQGVPLKIWTWTHNRHSTGPVQRESEPVRRVRRSSQGGNQGHDPVSKSRRDGLSLLDI